MVLSPETRFWKHVEKTDGCWNWTATHSNGYGIFWDGTFTKMGNKSAAKAHRFAYKLLKGEIPSDRELDHLCRNRSCVNPNHLEIVTTRENMIRGFSLCAINIRKKYCKRGHLLKADNLIPCKLKRGLRICIICARLLRRISGATKILSRMEEYHVFS